MTDLTREQLFLALLQANLGALGRLAKLRWQHRGTR
jgi:hypothetical protein